MRIQSPSTVLSAAVLAFLLAGDTLSLAAGADAAGETREDICAMVACRAPTIVRLAADDGSILEGQLPPGPYVLDGVINVLAGESLKVEAADTDGDFLSLRYAALDGDPDRTLTVSLEQLVSDTGNEMVFSIDNPLPHAVKFRIAANPPGSPDLIYTRSCPVAPGERSYEKWSIPIAQLVVFDLQILETGLVLSSACD